jgi:IS66 Orf2 like protein
MIHDQVSRSSVRRERSEARLARQSQPVATQPTLPHMQRRHTSTPGSRERYPNELRDTGSPGPGAPFVGRGAIAHRGADAIDIERQQIAIRMLNVVWRGDLIKVLWHDGLGLSLYAKRLERGRFIWPLAGAGVVAITSAQLGYLLEAIDWRNPQHTWRPQSAG